MWRAPHGRKIIVFLEQRQERSLRWLLQDKNLSRRKWKQLLSRRKGKQPQCLSEQTSRPAAPAASEEETKASFGRYFAPAFSAQTTHSLDKSSNTFAPLASRRKKKKLRARFQSNECSLATNVTQGVSASVTQLYQIRVCTRIAFRHLG